MNEPSVKLCVYGEPVAQGRPRFTAKGSRVIVYDPKKSRDYKAAVAMMAKLVAGEMLTGPLELVLRIYRSVPKSFSKKKRLAALEGALRPTQKPDLKNFLSCLEDSLEGIFYGNDSQIVSYRNVGKWYGEPPRIELELYKTAEEEENSGSQ